MKLVAFTAGRPRGNCEIFTKEALRGAQDKGVDVELIRLTDCDMHGCRACVPGFCPASIDPTKCPYGKDDAIWMIQKFLDSDGYIIAAPTYSLTPNSMLFDFRDRVFGPKMDVAGFMAGERPEPEFATGKFKARPGALIAVGGALTENWTSLSISSLFTTTFSAQTEVVDWMNVYGVADPNAAAIEDEWLAKAYKLGQNLADAMLTGDHRWRGEKEGTCPQCHQDLVQIVPGTDTVLCPLCGIYGTLSVEDGKISVVWPDDKEHRRDNRMDIDGKLVHLYEVRECMAKYKPRMEEAKEKAQKYHTWTDIIQTPPSKVRKAEERAAKAAELAAAKEEEDRLKFAEEGHQKL